MDNSLDQDQIARSLNRRELLGRCGMGFGLIGLAGFMADQNSAGAELHGECRITRCYTIGTARTQVAAFRRRRPSKSSTCS